MYNGLENLENHIDGGDERSTDGNSLDNQEENTGATSDQENSPSEVASNHEATEIHHPEESSEEMEHDKTDSISDFFKLLPYLYLVQRSMNSPNSSITSGLPEELPPEDISTNKLYESQRMKSLMHLQSLRNQLQANSFQYVFSNLQQFMPSSLANHSQNGFHEINDNQTDMVDEDCLLDSPIVHDEPLDLTQKNNNIRRVVEPKGRDDKLMRPNLRSERGYTIQDLEAALGDIKSGKLGTRRAAVIYGIPRSTLRNKVYKMGKNLSKSPNESQEKHLDRECHFRDQNGNTSKRSYTMTNTCEKRIMDDCDVNEIDDNCDNRNQLCISGKSNGIPYLDGSNNLLRIDTSSFNDGAKEENEGQNSLDDERNQLAFTMSSKGYSQRGRHISNSSLPLHNYPYVQGSSSYESMYADSSLGKKSRPKRGKYRNYDRDALSKAVLAVQNGEMSVHRAGSFFGVPHSTLEYKVKERHLLRQAKFKGKSTTKPASSKLVQPTAGCSSVTSLSPTAQPDSNDSSNNFQKGMPDLQRSLSHYLNMDRNFGGGSRWNTPIELLGLGFREPERDGNIGGSHKMEIKDSLPKIYDSNETCDDNPNDLLDLTKKT